MNEVKRIFGVEIYARRAARQLRSLCHSNCGRRFLIVALLPLLLALNAAAKTHSCSMAAPPVIEEGCEGEGCGSLEYPKAIKTVSLHKAPALSSPIVDQLRRCEPLTGFKPTLVIQRYGKATVQKSLPEEISSGVRKGDVVFIRSYRGEGVFAACIEDREIDLSEEADGIPGAIRVSQRPITENWIELKTPRGVTGFVLASEEFFMGHYSFSKDQVCPEDRRQ